VFPFRFQGEAGGHVSKSITPTPGMPPVPRPPLPYSYSPVIRPGDPNPGFPIHNGGANIGYARPMV